MNGNEESRISPVSTRGVFDSVSLEIPADLETPVSAFLKLRPLGATILLESVEKGEQVGRYSIIGVGTLFRITMDSGSCTISNGSREERLSLEANGGPIGVLRTLSSRVGLGDVDLGIPFLTSAIGYISYDMVRSFEKIPDLTPRGGDMPLLHLEIPRSLVVFDHVRRKAVLATLVERTGSQADTTEASMERLHSLSHAFRSPYPADIDMEPTQKSDPPVSNVTREQFEEMVRKGKEHIVAGDVFQVVLSQRLSGTTRAEPIQIYRALRMLNPSPYMFYLDGGPCQMIGSSPEALVTLQGGRATVRPIAGTRQRGGTPEEDQRLRAELVTDEKERAEHVMLVDLGRNDLGRVCEYGSVSVTELMKVEYYSHVMHMVSTVEGRLRKDHNMFDLLQATFPAGTVTGAPKIRAMEIIEDLEASKRGPYAGCVGYFDFRGNMDMCITIRTIVLNEGRYSLQAGAGIVYDSDPAREYEETLDKLRALRRAIEHAEEGLR